MGFGLVYGGSSAIVWNEPKVWAEPLAFPHPCSSSLMFADPAAHCLPQDEFPYVSGFVPILLSWFISPLIAGAPWQWWCSLSLLLSLLLRFPL